ncbi:MAG: SH3 domain-containing protein [Gemmiger formicilis]|uniref:SH3 domain-containing protein n=1 Tax=Gemmiger formicilis TaxID=745368 RepID=UPI0039925658
MRLRVGPDTSYEKISLVPEYTALQELGRSEDGCWMLTLYGRWHGWVSMDHLEKITQ